MPPPIKPNSLLLRLGLALSAIMGLAFLGMLSSVFIAEMGKGDAAAVNQAGSLRMQSYRIATELMYYQSHDPANYRQVVRQSAAAFEERLASARLTNALPSSRSEPLRQAYDDIARRWHKHIKPLLNSYPEPSGNAEPSETIPGFQHTYLTSINTFVDEIDALVKLLEDHAEAKIERLRVIQVITLFLTAAVVLVTMHLMHVDVLIPLRDLLTCAERARHGDFSVRVAHVSDDELGRLGRAFNVMSEDLSHKYADLEARVREKTANLEQSNRSLDLLYRSSVLLNGGPPTEAIYSRLLEDIRKLVGTGAGSICLAGHGDNQAMRLASTRHPDPDEPDLCQPPNCARCFGNGEIHRIEVRRPVRTDLKVISIPIREQNRQHGVLLLELPPSGQLHDWQVRLLETVAQHIANALTLADKDSEARRLALLEERGVIARELHDSLAQSLSYLKIQVSRIAAALGKPDLEQAQAVIGELREGVNSAYRQLRELLTTFRLRMQGRGLGLALEETVLEFQQRNAIQITLVNRLHQTQLSANEEIHTLQLLREAIINVVKHARAQHAQVELYSDERGQVTVRVDDNGIGIPPAAARQQHYGLAIMQERADILGGHLVITRRPEGGTRVELTFTPINRSPMHATS